MRMGIQLGHSLSQTSIPVYASWKLSQCAVLYWPENHTGPDLLGLLISLILCLSLCPTFVVRDSGTKYVDVFVLWVFLEMPISGHSKTGEFNMPVKS